MIETYLFEYFVAFYEEGSLLKASEKLHISQPSLTRAMKKLESELEITLFKRTKNKITLNDNGVIILEYAKRIIDIQNAIKKKADEIKRNIISLKIGLTAPGPIYKYSFFKLDEKINVTTLIEKEDILIQKINDGIIDIAFINNKINNSHLICQKAFSEHLHIWVPKTHFLANKKNGILFKEADGQSFLLSENLGIWEEITRNNLPNSRLYFQDSNDLIDIVNASKIPAFITNVTMNSIKDNQRVAIAILDKIATIDFYIVYKKNDDLLKKVVDKILYQSKS